MQSTRHLLAALCFALLTQSCSQQTPPEKKSVERAPAPVRIEPKNGLYELADVVAWAMPAEADSLNTALPAPQDYNRFKGVVTDIAASKSKLGGYEGRVSIGVNGKRTIAENIEDDYQWKVFIFGPQVGATTFAIASWRSVSVEVGPSYLRSKNFDLVNLSCFSEGDTPNNAKALYLARYPGKLPTLITYSVSTGSGGKTVDYRIHFGGVQWDAVPAATDINFKGESQAFASCPYKELL